MAAYCSEATVLHFRARWKSGPEQDPIAVARLLAIAQSGAWWPSALKLEIPTGTIEQRVFFKKICPGAVRRKPASRKYAPALRWSSIA